MLRLNPANLPWKPFFFSPPSHSSGIAILSEMGGLSIVVWGGVFLGGGLKGRMGSCGGEKARIC